MIVVERTAPLLTVQDAGRIGYFADGVTQSGPLDPLAFALGNALVGNAAGAAALEGCLGGAQFRCERDCTFALTGAEVVATVVATIGPTAIGTYESVTAQAGDVIAIERVTRGTVWYLAIRGGIEVPVILGSRSTLIAAGLGGLDGGPIKAGARLASGAQLGGPPVVRAVPTALRSTLDESPIPLTTAPRFDALEPAEWETLYKAAFTVSHSLSRVGYRLEGPTLSSRLPADLASEPACRGAVQLPPDGHPIVLMADHPTIGGYPIIGVVAAHAIGRFAQRAPGKLVQFAPMSLDDARAARQRERDALSKWVARD